MTHPTTRGRSRLLALQTGFEGFDWSSVTALETRKLSSYLGTISAPIRRARIAFEDFLMERIFIFSVDLDGLFEKQYRDLSRVVDSAVRNRTWKRDGGDKAIAVLELEDPWENDPNGSYEVTNSTSLETAASPH